MDTTHVGPIFVVTAYTQPYTGKQSDIKAKSYMLSLYLDNIDYLLP